MPRLIVRHVTTYRYRQPVVFGEHRMMLRPIVDERQCLLDASLRISPAPSDLRFDRDEFGNHVAIARFAEPACELRVDSEVAVHAEPLSLDDVTIDPAARSWPFSYAGADEAVVAAFLARDFPADRTLDAWLAAFLDGAPSGTRDLLAALNVATRAAFRYRRREEKGIQSPGESLAHGSGTCRDYAVFMIEAARALGFAARFVSGYIRVLDENEATSAPVRRGGGATHAWAQVYLPGGGWVDLDPTNGLMSAHDLVRVAVVREPSQALPLHGTYFGSSADEAGMTVEVEVS